MSNDAQLRSGALVKDQFHFVDLRNVLILFFFFFTLPLPHYCFCTSKISTHRYVYRLISLVTLQGVMPTHIVVIFLAEYSWHQRIIAVKIASWVILKLAMKMRTIVNKVTESTGEYKRELELHRQCNPTAYVDKMPFPLVLSQFVILLETCLETFKAKCLTSFWVLVLWMLLKREATQYI